MVSQGYETMLAGTPGTNNETVGRESEEKHGTLAKAHLDDDFYVRVRVYSVSTALPARLGLGAWFDFLSGRPRTGDSHD